ncbi:GNAT family N-acetyltransferase [Marinilactibacillus sp. GCM10026970]|uniref:GNAT family N-acetyltransferase n=1 Tax=Marinilactibacillus sp. GCM10026970 TaxID=3252642 RepID=UPI00360A4A51
MEKHLKSVIATSSDYEKVFNTLLDTAKWLNKKGSNQWGDLLLGNDVHRTDRAILNQNVYMAYSKDIYLGIFILLETQSSWDAELWGEDSEGRVTYLHRVALAKEAHGSGNGKLLMRIAMNRAIRNGNRMIRLDCVADNHYLNQFYKDAGFTLVETDKKVSSNSHSKFNLYEKTF